MTVQVGSHESSLKFRVPAGMNGWRVDRALAGLCGGLGRSVVRAAIDNGLVSVDSKLCRKPREQVAQGDVLVVQGGFPAAGGGMQTRTAPSVLNVVAEDDELLIVDKPAGMVSHPAGGSRTGTLADSIAACRPEMARLPRAGLAHRLDKDTSGLLAAVKNEQAALNLCSQFKSKSAGRVYLAIVHGRPPATGELSMPMGRDPANRLRMRVHPEGREAKTRFTVVRSGAKFSLLRCVLATGRTHQIRTHLEHDRHPVAGDRVYRRYSGSHNVKFPRQMLHATELELEHPATGKRVAWRSVPPEDFCSALRRTGLA